ncbi:MAG: endonuclease/exonuclease/phosphatase family protein [Isosphaeraceae bacterium]|nr:endonuclease/exonuclease/phosphatase family protein [Isosphaeraceae bacterium]
MFRRPELRGDASSPKDERALSRVPRVGRLRSALLLPPAAGASIAALIPALSTALARHSWVLDALTHFRPLAPWTALAAAAGWALLRRRILALGLVGFAIWQWSGIEPFDGPNPVEPDRDRPERLRILMANVYHPNADFERVAALIRRERPDIVGLVEVSYDWIDGLERTGIREEFPYRVEVPLGGQGLALWLREAPHRLEPAQVFSSTGNPVCKATLAFGGGLTTLWLVHPPNPVGGGRERANPDFAALAEQIGLRGGSQIVVGDLNRTEHSPYFHDFLATTRLRDSRFGFGPQPSWPTWSPYRIPLDHALVSPDVAVVDRRLGESIGSDHLPIILDVAPASASRKSRN